MIGTRFLTLAQLARDVLAGAGVAVGSMGDEVRAVQVRARLETLPAGALEAFDGEALRRDVGWDEAFAQAIRDLEGAGLTPESAGRSLPRAIDAGVVRDVAALWSHLNETSSTWSRARVLSAAAERIAPGLAADPTLFVITGHESVVESRLVRAVPDVRLAARACRPAAAEWLDRLEALWGSEAREAVTRTTAFTSRSARDFLARYLFASPEILASSTRDRATQDDPTVQLEQHAGVDAELDAAATWVASKIIDDGMALDDIAVLAPHADPWLDLLHDRIEARLPASAAVCVPEGVRFGSSADGARGLAVLRALASHLTREQLAQLLPLLTTPEPIAHSAAIAACAAAGGLGGAEERPHGALEWTKRFATALERTRRTLADESAGPGAPRRNTKLHSLERDLTAIAQPIAALMAVAERVLSNAELPDILAAYEAFLRDHLRLTDPPLTLGRIRGGLAAHLATPNGPRGRDALHLLLHSLESLRVPIENDGNPAVLVGTVRGARGLAFRAVRVLGLSEGSLPSVPRQDPILSDPMRRALRLPTASLRATEHLQALHQIIGDTRDEVVLSCPRQNVDGSQREPSSIFVDAAAALGAHPGPLVPSRDVVEHHYFRRSRAAREASPHRYLDPHAVFRGVAIHELRRPRSWSDDDVLAPERSLQGAALREPGGLLHAPPVRRPLPGTSPERPISASRLATLLTCPRWFLFESVLGLDEPLTAPSTGGLSALDYGSLFHRVAERFALEHGAAFGRRERSLDEWLADIHALASRELDAFLEGSPISDPDVRRQEGERLAEDLRRWMEHDWSGGAPRVFVGAERAFGFDPPIALDVEGEPLFVYGFIDRLDIEREKLFVRDLKTGRSTPRRGKSAGPDPSVDLQLALYGRVARQLAETWGTPAEVAVAYVHPRSAEIERRFDDDYAALEEASAEWLGVAAALLRKGAFPRTPNPDDCAFCPFKPACGPPRSAPPDVDDATARFLAWKARR